MTRSITLIIVISITLVAAVLGSVFALNMEDPREAIYKPVGAMILSVPFLIAAMGLVTLTRKPALMPGAFVGLAGLITVWIILWVQIFYPNEWHTSGDNSERWLGTVLAAAFAMIPATAAALLAAIRPLRACGYTLAGCGVAAFVVWILGIWTSSERGDFATILYVFSSTRDARFGWMFLYVGSITSFSLIGSVFRQRRIVEWIVLSLGVLAGLTAMVIVTIDIWDLAGLKPEPTDPPYAYYNFRQPEPFVYWRGFYRALTFAILAGHAKLMLQLRYATFFKYTNWLALATTGSFCALLFTYTFLEVGDPGYNDLVEQMQRYMSVSGYGAALFTLIVAGLWLLLRRYKSRIEPVLSFSTLERICPQCGDRAIAPLGASICGKCGIKFNLAVEEPRCEHCGFLLYLQTSDRCPECGVALGKNVVKVSSIAASPPLPPLPPETPPVGSI